MPETLDESAIRQIHQISRQLAHRNGLSNEEAEEIGAHLEDKLLAYLRGEVRISGQDALLLAHAHFGDAAGLARQVQLAADLADPHRRRTRAQRRTAMTTAACAIIGLPLTLCLFANPPGNWTDLFAIMRVALPVLAVLEAGMMVAARAALQSGWQRALAAAFLVPSLLAFAFAVASSLSALGTNWASASRGGDYLVAAILLACLLGHGVLLLLLAVPLRQNAQWTSR